MTKRRPRRKNPVDLLLIGGGVLLFSVVAKAFGGKSMKVLKQNDPDWGKYPIGNTTSTIGQVGCLLVSLTMIKNFLLGTNDTPKETNKIVKNAGGYSGALTVVPVAAQVLGLSAPESKRIRAAKAGDPSLVATVEAALSSGGVAVIHVDHNQGNVSSSDIMSTLAGDHFLTVFGKHGPNYLAADPAPGTVIELNPKLSGESMWGSTKKFYNTVGAFQVHKL